MYIPQQKINTRFCFPCERYTEREKWGLLSFFFFSFKEREIYCVFIWDFHSPKEALLTLNCPFLSFTSLSLSLRVFFYAEKVPLVKPLVW